MEKITKYGENGVLARKYSETLGNKEYILRELFNNQEYDSVVDTCIEYLTSYRKDYVCWYFLGLVYKERGEPKKVKQAIKLHEKYWKQWYKENEAQW